MQPSTASTFAETSVRTGYTVETVSDRERVLVLRRDWQTMSRDPDADIDFYLAVIQTESKVDRPHVICVRQGGTIKAMLVARIEKRPLELALGYKKLSSPPLRFLTTAHGGLLGEDSEEVACLLIEAVRDSLRKGEADAACFYGIDANTVFHRMLQRTGGFMTRDPYPTSLPRWRVRLPGSYDQFLRSRSSNTRHNVKRYSKRFQEAFGNESTIRTFRQADEVDAMLADTEAIACKTYHRGLGVGFLHNEQTRIISLLSARQGWLRAHILYVRGVPCAFWNGWLYNRTFFTWNTGYDPAFNDSRPGLFLLQHMFKELCTEGIAEEVDFGFGDAQYKRDWCDHEVLQISRLLFAPTIKGVLFNMMRIPLIAGTNGALALMKKTNLLVKVKKLWRSRAANARIHKS
jgi:hypothetical protein